MNTFGQRLGSLVRSALTIFVGYVVVALVNIVGGWLLDALFPGARTEDGLPLTTPARIADLVMLFAAGMGGGFVVMLASHFRPWLHVLVFGITAVIIDLYVVLTALTDQPLWYTAILLVTVPVQVWVGAKLGQRVRSSKE